MLARFNLIGYYGRAFQTDRYYFRINASVPYLAQFDTLPTRPYLYTPGMFLGSIL